MKIENKTESGVTRKTKVRPKTKLRRINVLQKRIEIKMLKRKKYPPPKKNGVIKNKNCSLVKLQVTSEKNLLTSEVVKKNKKLQK